MNKFLDKARKKLQKIQAQHPTRIKESVEDYVMFYSLRNHGIVGKKVCTEQIYIHSKLMIVDDTKVIVGTCSPRVIVF